MRSTTRGVFHRFLDNQLANTTSQNESPIDVGAHASIIVSKQVNWRLVASQDIGWG